VAIFITLSVIAAITTVIDRQSSNRSARDNKAQLEALARDNKAQLEALIASSATLAEQNQQLLQSNAVLRERVAEAAAAPQRVAMQGTLKSDIQRHLARVSAFLSEEKRKFNKESFSIPPADYPQHYMGFRRQLSASYVSRYYNETRRLLLSAAEMKLIPAESFEIDSRFIDAGLIPYVDDLQKLAARLPD
jgi:hypothetical protein